MYDPDVTGPRHFIEAVSCAGFEASPLAEAHASLGGQARALAEWRRLLLWAVAFTIPTFLISMVRYISLHPTPSPGI